MFVPLDPDLQDQLLAALKPLRAFAISLCRDGTRAEDLVQETVVKAISKLHRLEVRTDLQAWLFTILRNTFYSQMRTNGREIEDADGQQAARMVSIPEQMGHLAFHGLRQALLRLPPHHREALLLVGAQGFSYEETARICGVAVGTIKSRVNRARQQLALPMGEAHTNEIGYDSLTLATVNRTA
jgi:RNA polymerase sigma-70 factor (ECF subfamily)